MDYTDEEIRVMIDEDRETFIKVIQNADAFTDNLHERHNECMHLYRLAQMAE